MRRPVLLPLLLTLAACEVPEMTVWKGEGGGGTLTDPQSGDDETEGGGEEGGGEEGGGDEGTGTGGTGTGGGTGGTGTGGDDGATGGGTGTGGDSGTGTGGGTGGGPSGLVSDFSLEDLNTSSPRVGQTVSPRDYLEQVSGWYFIHST